MSSYQSNTASILSRGKAMLNSAPARSSAPIPMPTISQMSLAEQQRVARGIKNGHVPPRNYPPTSETQLETLRSAIDNNPDVRKEIAWSHLADMAPTKTNEEMTESKWDETGEATPCPEHVVGKKGIQMRACCVTYYPGGKTPIHVHEAPQFPPDFFHGHVLKPRNKHLTYYVSALEVAPTTKLLHGHIYMEFDIPHTIVQIKKILETEHAKVFIRKGTQRQAIEYVYKIGAHADKAYTRLLDTLQRYGVKLTENDIEDLSPFQYGERRQQGTRSDLDRYVEMAFDGIQRNEFLATERGAGLRYFKYFSDACSVVDGLNRDDTVRANKRVLYNKYVEDCEDKGINPLRFFEFQVDHDYKWNPDSLAHYVESMSSAMEEREQRDDDDREAVVNKRLLDATLPEESGDVPPSTPKSHHSRQSSNDDE